MRVAAALILSAAVGGAALFAADVNADGADGRKFDSRERLVRTALLDDRADLAETRDALAAARAELEAAIAAGAPEDEIRELENEVERRAETLEAAQEDLRLERRRLERVVNALSDDQVFAFNRSLQNALASGLWVDLDSEGLIAALNEDYDKRQINAYTKALESDAKFTRKAESARAAYESTHDPELLRQAERFEAKAESQREKFLAKIERFDATSGERKVRDELHEEARTAAREEARNAARVEARRAAQEEARIAAREAGRDAARDAARDEARRGARDLARQEARSAAKQQGRRLAKGHDKRD